MAFYFAKLLQLIGFTHVGYALFVGLTEENAMASELKLLGLGVILFYSGRLLERKAVA